MTIKLTDRDVAIVRVSKRRWALATRLPVNDSWQLIGCSTSEVQTFKSYSDAYRRKLTLIDDVVS